MIKHEYTENSEINFLELEERIKLINKPEQFTFWQFQRKLLDGYFLENFSAEEIGPILIMATGGSKAVAYFLQMLLEKVGMISEVIETRDFFYKQNISSYKNLISISTSGKTNGIEDAFNVFKGKKYI
jgi:glucosamine 6-phosphate synthetase-like amidotransferase/phosphosugar isomerase protein